jgi:glycosyltransferase involved in cell wall biosynthesis
MKILHVGSPLTTFTGDMGLIFKASKGLIDSGHELTIITTDANSFFYDKEKSEMFRNTRKELVNAVNKPIVFKGVPLRALHCTIHKLGFFCPDAKKVAREIISNYDVVHVCTWYSHICMIFAQVAIEKNIPFIVSSWGSLLPTARKLKGSQKWIADQLYTKKILKHATGFQSVGESERKEFLRLGATPESIYRLDNPVELEKFEITEKSNIINEYNISNKKFLLFIGRINEKKGIELLLESFVKITENQKELLLVLAGSGTKEYVKKIKELTKKMRLEKKVIFTGLITENEKLDMLESASLFVLTSHSDVHPIAVQDALTMSLPVIITEACDYPEVKDYDAGLIIDEDVEQITNAILSIIDDEERLKKMANNARRLVLEKFQLKVQIKKYEEMYRDVIKRHNQIQIKNNRNHDTK